MIVDFLLWFLSFSLVASLKTFFFLYSSHLYYVYKRIICKRQENPTWSPAREGQLVYRHLLIELYDMRVDKFFLRTEVIRFNPSVIARLSLEELIIPAVLE